MKIFFRRAFSLIEITLALFLMAFVTGGLLFGGRVAIEQARQEKTWRTLSALLEISAQYHAEKGKLPSSLEEIQVFDPRVPLLNPWGDAYLVVPGALSWCVETRVPLGTGRLYLSGAFASVFADKDGDWQRVCRPVISKP